MLRCGRCGSSKFIFTTRNDSTEYHGAACAVCHKRLNPHDVCIRSAESVSVWPAKKGDKHAVCYFTDKPLRG